MLTFLKRNIFIAFIFIVTLTVSFVTFLTFIDKGFISLNEKNLNYLLIANIILLLLFFSIIIYEIKNPKAYELINLEGKFAIKNIDQIKNFLIDNAELSEHISKIIVFPNNNFWSLI